MNIENTKINNTKDRISNYQKNVNANNTVNFSDELNELNLKAQDSIKTEETQENISVVEETSEENIEEEISEESIEEAVEDLNDIVKEMNDKNLNQSEEFLKESLEKDNKFTDKIDKGIDLLNNDLNITENKDLLAQMSMNMSFSGNGQPFSSFMNAEEVQQKTKQVLAATAVDLAEEAAILSTMEENIELANKNSRLVERNDGIKKIDLQTGVTIETVVKYDNIIMNEADIEVFTTLVEKGEVNLNNLAPQAAEKAVSVSKTLADLLAKSMTNNQPLRIDFDNNISVIIRISRDGKISADFLPSSQIAEAYLKENLPLLKQRFDENNIKYDELNQRERRQQHKEQNEKKGRNDE